MSSNNSSNNSSKSSANTSANNNFQYASTAPSVSSLLNLPQVQDKKKPGAAVGLAKKPFGALGLAAPSTTVKTTATGTLKLLPKTPKGHSVDNVSTLVSTLDIKEAEQPKPKDTETVKINPSTDNITALSKVMKTKVEKPKSQTQNSSNNKASKAFKQQVTPSTAQSAQAQVHSYFDPSHWRLFVGNLGPEVTDSLLLSTFQNPYPSCSKALLVRDWKSQKSKGYGFVAFADGKEFLRALKEMQGKWIGNRQCIIKKSEHQPKFN